MKKRRKKRITADEEDLLFYLENWGRFPDHFQKIAQKEINELQEKIKNK